MDVTHPFFRAFTRQNSGAVHHNAMSNQRGRLVGTDYYRFARNSPQRRIQFFNAAHGTDLRQLRR